MGNALGIDIGGTKLAGAAVDERGVLLGEMEHPTQVDAVFRSTSEMVEKLLAEFSDVTAIGLAVAGFVENDSDKISFAPNLRKIEPDLCDRVADKFGLFTVAENDANAAAWAESRFGAGMGAKNMLMLTIGTGIGGGIVIDDKLYRGSRGYAAEFGHMVASVNGELCACGKQGCLEAMASGTALARIAKELAAEHPDSEVLRLAEGQPEKITGAMVGEAARNGDEFALEMFRRTGRFLGLGLAGLANAFDPEIIVLGGGVAESGEPFLRPAAEQLAERFQGLVPPPPVVPAKLGNQAGVIGAAALAAAQAKG